MSYTVKGKSNNNGEAKIIAKSNNYVFGIKSNQSEFCGPAEILLSSFAACCLKNVERFSSILNYQYDSAEIEVTGIRQEKPSMINKIDYTLSISSKDKNLNIDLLHKNLKKFGTIYNTLNAVCEINGKLILNNHV
jgi:uncharacterized OsmC-like protein